MVEKISKDLKKEIFKLISTPGIEVEDIAKKVNVEFEKVMEILSDEYLKTNLNFGRRLCCR